MNIIAKLNLSLSRGSSWVEFSLDVHFSSHPPTHPTTQKKKLVQLSELAKLELSLAQFSPSLLLLILKFGAVQIATLSLLHVVPRNQTYVS